MIRKLNKIFLMFINSFNENKNNLPSTAAQFMEEDIENL